MAGKETGIRWILKINIFNAIFSLKYQISGPAFSAYKKEGDPSKNYLETVIRLYPLK